MVPGLDLVFRISSIELVILEYNPGIIGALGSPFLLFLEKASLVVDIFASGLFESFEF